jgi:hypothetical protein
MKTAGFTPVLKHLVAELSLDKTMLQDVLRKSCEAVAAPAAG